MREVSCENMYAFHPGYYVEEIIEDMAVTQEEFAARLGMEEEIIRELVDGHIGLSDELAKKLSWLLGMNSEFWLALQKKYDDCHLLAGSIYYGSSKL